MHHLIRNRASRTTNTPAPSCIRVTLFQPFPSRVGTDQVFRLDFTYDPTLIAHLKCLLAQHKTQAVDPSQGRLTSGGWLNREGCWFIEPCIWGAVRRELEQLGYHIEECLS